MSKMQHVLAAHDRWLGITWEPKQLAKAKGTPDCEVRLDRLEFTAPGVSENALLGIPGFRRTGKPLMRRKHPDEFLSHRRLAKFVTDGSIREMWVQSEPQYRHIAGCKVTMLARDKSGLQPKDVMAVLELIPQTKIVRMEVAFDFGFSSGVDGTWIRAHALFGKSRFNRSASLRCYDCWGSRKGGKFVRSYFKKELRVHRVELQLNPKFLRQHGIDEVFDFHRLLQILPRAHIEFFRFDPKKARHQLRLRGKWGREFYQIVARVEENEGDLYAQCSVLRKRGGLRNTRRMLTPLAENRLIRKALKNWAAQWAKKANRLGAK
jgi:hypothetical protein